MDCFNLHFWDGRRSELIVLYPLRSLSDVSYTNTYVFLHRIQNQSLQLVEAIVDSRTPSLLHNWLIALLKIKIKSIVSRGVSSKAARVPRRKRKKGLLLFSAHE